MAGDDALGEQFLQRFDWITLVQRTERRSDGEGTCTDTIDRVAFCAVRADENEASYAPAAKALLQLLRSAAKYSTK